MLGRGLDELRPAHWRLSTKIVVAFLVLATGAVWFFSKQSEVRSTEVLTSAESRLLTGLAASLAIQVDSQVMQDRRAAIQVATDPEVISYVTRSPSDQASGAGALLRRLRPELNIDPDYRQLLILESKGRVLISNEPGVQQQDFSGREFFTRGLIAAADDPYVSDITLAEDRRSQVMYTALPIRDALGTVLGVAAVRLSPDGVAAQLKSRDLNNRHSYGLLVNHQGVILANSAQPALNYRSLGSLDPTQREQVKRQFLLPGVPSLGLDGLADQVVGTRNSGFAAARLLGSKETDVIGFAPVSSRGWTVLVAEAQAVFTADVSDLARSQSLNALVLALIIGGLVIFVGRLFESTERELLADPLTGLANRRFLEGILLRELRRAHRSKLPVSLVFADIDHFKRVNDTYGHKVGDEVLQHVAGAMLAGVRTTDFAVRYGGEEFVILLPETRRDDAQQVADKLRSTIAQTIVESTSRPGVTLKCTISAGLAAYPVDCGSGEELILKADRALYYAKRHGRNRVVTVTEADAPGWKTFEPAAPQAEASVAEAPEVTVPVASMHR
jgi:diguanylate cyclase (GGDEF)-like protein